MGQGSPWGTKGTEGLVAQSHKLCEHPLLPWCECDLGPARRQKDRLNGELDPAELKKYCPLGEEERKFMEKAYSSLGLSMRVYHKIIKVSRTIADLAGEPEISVGHIAEALQYRGLESIYRR